jgi:argininosuccinate lyase
MALLTTMKGLPLTYNKDMQEDKESLFDAVDTVEKCLMVMRRLLGELSFNKKVMKKAIDKGYLVATDLADYLVGRGLTFRKAHQIVGEMVLYGIGQEKELNQLTLDEMKRFSKEIDNDVYAWLDPVQCVKRRNLPGGTAPEQVKKSIKKAKREIG